MALAILSGGDRETKSILDAPVPAVAQPEEPAEPTVPVAE
jgi:hypothetical protein